ncbi:unnamed protein product, partial [Urochloa humidicola]
PSALPPPTSLSLTSHPSDPLAAHPFPSLAIPSWPPPHRPLLLQRPRSLRSGAACPNGQILRRRASKLRRHRSTSDRAAGIISATNACSCSFSSAATGRDSGVQSLLLVAAACGRSTAADLRRGEAEWAPPTPTGTVFLLVLLLSAYYFDLATTSSMRAWHRRRGHAPRQVPCGRAAAGRRPVPRPPCRRPALRLLPAQWWPAQVLQRRPSDPCDHVCSRGSIFTGSLAAGSVPAGSMRRIPLISFEGSTPSSASRQQDQGRPSI